MREEGVDIDFVEVDNTASQFASAGAALNHGIRMGVRHGCRPAGLLLVTTVA
jgi:hypothetical protein